MSGNGFVDYYEALELSSTADTDTIERIYRHLARKFHPDNKKSGDSERFRLIVEAHRTLSDPEKRAGYDVEHQDYWNRKWKIASEAGNGTSWGNDRETRENLLSILYIQRRRNMRKPGMGEYEFTRLLSLPLELVEFHLWYLKAKGWVERIDTGAYAISALGVDQIEQGRLRPRKDRMLTAGGVSAEGMEETVLSGPADLPEFPRAI